MSGRWICVAAAMLPLLSCSVKEERGECPCHLRLSFGAEWTGNVSVSAWDAEGCVFCMGDVLKDAVDGVAEYDVVRGRYTLCVSQLDSGSGSDGRAVIRRGSQADSLYAWASGAIDTDRENLDVRPSRNKQFATIYLSITSRSEMDYNIIVSGGVNGLDLRTLEPIAGEFACRAVKDDGWYYRFRLPRQPMEAVGDGLSLEVYSGSDLISEFPLGEEIMSAGYDWSAESLQDIYVDVDMNQVRLSVSVGDWEDGGENAYKI